MSQTATLRLSWLALEAAVFGKMNGMIVGATADADGVTLALTSNTSAAATAARKENAACAAYVEEAAKHVRDASRKQFARAIAEGLRTRMDGADAAGGPRAREKH